MGMTMTYEELPEDRGLWTKKEHIRHAADVIGWSGPMLRRLRVEAGLSAEVMAIAYRSSTRGLLRLEGREYVTVRQVSRYRKALAVADDGLKLVEVIEGVIADTRSPEGTAASRSLPSSVAKSPSGDRTNNEMEIND